MNASSCLQSFSLCSYRRDDDTMAKPRRFCLISSIRFITAEQIKKYNLCPAKKKKQWSAHFARPYAKNHAYITWKIWHCTTDGTHVEYDHFCLSSHFGTPPLHSRNESTVSRDQSTYPSLPLAHTDWIVINTCRIASTLVKQKSWVKRKYFSCNGVNRILKRKQKTIRIYLYFGNQAHVFSFHPNGQWCRSGVQNYYTPGGRDDILHRQGEKKKNLAFWRMITMPSISLSFWLFSIHDWTVACGVESEHDTRHGQTRTRARQQVKDRQESCYVR